MNLTGPFHGTGDGRVVEVERALRKLETDGEPLPDVIFVDDIESFTRAVFTHDPVVKINGPIQGGMIISGYMYNGRVISISSRSGKEEQP